MSGSESAMTDNEARDILSKKLHDNVYNILINYLSICEKSDCIINIIYKAGTDSWPDRYACQFMGHFLGYINGADIDYSESFPSIPKKWYNEMLDLVKREDYDFAGCGCIQAAFYAYTIAINNFPETLYIAFINCGYDIECYETKEANGCMDILCCRRELNIGYV